jgi:hypothetical protein
MDKTDRSSSLKEETERVERARQERARVAGIPEASKPPILTRPSVDEIVEILGGRHAGVPVGEVAAFLRGYDHAMRQATMLVLETQLKAGEDAP